MPMEVGVFFQHASSVSPDAILRVNPDTQSITSQNTMSGLGKLISSGQKTENRKAVQAFMDAIDRNPAYAELAGQMKAPLEELIRSGKPLTARHVEQARSISTAAQVSAGVDMGKTLATQGKLPAGHGTSFGQYAVAHELPLDTPAHVGTAVKEYLLAHVVQGNEANLAQVSNMGDKNTAITTLLCKTCAPLGGQDGFYAKAIDHALAGGLENFSFTALEHALETQNTATIDILRGLDANDISQLQNMNTGPMLETMKEALPQLGQDGMRPLYMFMASNMPHIATTEQRAGVIRDFMLGEAISTATHPILAEHGLPENFDVAIGHNPEVVKNAQDLLNVDPGAGVIPTKARVTEALQQATQSFVTAHEPVLHEFMLMAMDPPADIKPPLTLETLPRYLNTMLAGDDVLEPLLNDSVPIDAAFMAKLSKQAEAMNSASHCIKGDFGADDAVNVLRNSITLLLTRRGVTADMYPEIMGRTMEKFGKLSSDLTTLNGAVQKGYGKGAGMDFLLKGMSVFRVVEGQARALLSLMPREQRTELGLTLPTEPTPDDTDGLRAEGALLTNFLEGHFENEGDVEELPAHIRDFARANGLPMPDIDPLVVARMQRQELSELKQANDAVEYDILEALVPSTGHLREVNSAAFHAAFTEIAQSHDLTGLNPDSFPTSSLYPALRRAVSEFNAQATAAGRTVTPAELNAVAHTVLTQAFVELKATLNAIDAMPEREVNGQSKNADGVLAFTPQEKIIMKETAQLYGLHNPAAIATLTNAVRADSFITKLQQMCSPAANDAQLSQTASQMAKEYIAAKQAIGDVPGSEDAMAIMIEMGMKMGGITAEQATSLANNLESATAHQVTKAFYMARDIPNATPAAQLICAGVPAMMNQVRMLASQMIGQNPVMEPMFFSDALDHLCEVPGETMRVLQSILGNAIPTAATEMAMHVPPFTAEQWDKLVTVADSLRARVPAEHAGMATLLNSWVTDSADDLLKAMDANKGKTLSDGQIWEAIVGERMPKNVKSELLGVQMLATVDQRYKSLILAAAPDTSAPMLRDALTLHSGMGIGPKKMFELTKPGASLTLADIHTDMHMSSLRDYGPDNAYGLVTDFRRRHPSTEMTFTDKAHNGIAIQPQHIPDQENNPTNPVFQHIIETVRGMTHSEAQTARVLQGFSQAALIMPRILSTYFPGVAFSEHGSFVVNATEQDDGSVLLNITSDPSLPLVMTQQFKIETDGSHTCTAFEMKRPPVAE